MLHPGHEHLHAHEVMTWWTPRPIVMSLMALTTGLYLAGAAKLWRRSGVGHGVRRLEVAAYLAGMATILVAIVSPVDKLSELLFSVHMSQHELLMVIAAPLLVIGRPLVVMLFGLPDSSRAALLRTIDRPFVNAVWRVVTDPLLVLALHAVALWVWHIPALYEAALRSDTIHTIEHLCFFGTACLFWWAVVHGRYGRAGYGVSVAYVFVTALTQGLLGALLSVAQRPWYPLYTARTTALGLDPVEDQQLAGLVMWIPASLVFLVVGLALFAAWLGAAEKSRRRLDRHAHE